MITIGIVAAEASGDLLGAGLMKALKKQHPNCCFVGIGGDKMHHEGLRSLFSIHHLQVMGLSEVISKLPSLLALRRKLIKHFLHHRPDVFIGIDAPDFNLTLEKKLKQSGIKTIHYVSPSVWAWRQGRIKTIKKATDLVLTLFPFEHAFYQKHAHKATFVGHPLADEIPLQPTTQKAKKALNLSPSNPVLALLPGSRAQELNQLLPAFIETIQYCKQKCPHLQVLLSIANQGLNPCVAPYQAQLDALGIQPIVGQTENILCASDSVLLCSGTATLQTMLYKKPMVVAYKTSTLTYVIAKMLVKLKHIALPNILANERLVDEFIQHQVNPKALSERLLTLLKSPNPSLVARYQKMHQQLKQNANVTAANAVLSLIHENHSKAKSC